MKRIESKPLRPCNARLSSVGWALVCAGLLTAIPSPALAGEGAAATPTLAPAGAKPVPPGTIPCPSQRPFVTRCVPVFQSPPSRYCGRSDAEQARALAWQCYAHGAYVAQARVAHVAEYRLRVDDQLDLVYTLTHEKIDTPYRLAVGDQIAVESFTDADLNRQHTIQPDGSITLRLLGQVPAAGKTIPELRDDLEKLYEKYYKVPAITVQPVEVNSKLEALRATVDRRFGVGGQSQGVRVTPEGTISVPMIGCVWAQGLTLTELEAELNARYRVEVQGMHVVPVLVQRAPRYIYVLGEVRVPGRYTLDQPTNLLQAVSMAGGWNHGANLRQVLVFRLNHDWRLLGTRVNIQPTLYNYDMTPEGNLWLADSDVVVVPKNALQVADDFIDLTFTRGIYGVFPFQGATLNFSKISSL